MHRSVKASTERMPYFPIVAHRQTGLSLNVPLQKVIYAWFLLVIDVKQYLLVLLLLSIPGNAHCAAHNKS